jgi:MFS family permease
MVSRKYRRATLTAFLLFVCQQLSGINAVVYFSTQIFRDAGVTSAVLSSLLVMLVNVAGTAFVAAPLIDRFGRTTMLSASYAGMATSMAVMGGCLAAPSFAV